MFVSNTIEKHTVSSPRLQTIHTSSKQKQAPIQCRRVTKVEVSDDDEEEVQTLFGMNHA